MDDSWKEIPGPNSLTFSNLGQHNLQQQELESVPAPSGISPQAPAPPKPPRIETAAESGPAPAPSVAEGKVVPTASSKPGLKSAAPPPPTQQVAHVPSQSPSRSKDTFPAPGAPTKTAWSKEDDAKKAKHSGIALGLREIQEAEAKKAEARRAAERERAARNAVPATSPDEGPAFTASWGLPTSQTRNHTSPKEAQGSSPGTAAPSAPVWTAAAKVQPAKKTMKEIQEEEERRKKTAVKETAAAAARRAYADTTTKVRNWCTIC
jgi:PERQ amino acid-rich with GYF domain-containing protein